jgi:hypothetical protein
MRVGIADGVLSIGRSRLIVLADDTSSDVRLRNAVAFAVGTARRRGIEARCGQLGHAALTAAPQPVRGGGGVRGRFLTPLVEAGLLEDAGAATLVCLIDGPVYDWDDWADDLQAAFGRIHILRFSSIARVHAGAIEHRVEGADEPAIERVLVDAIAAGGATGVTIDVPGGVVLGMPAELRAVPAGAGVRYTALLLEAPLTAPVLAVSTRQADDVAVTVRYDGGAEELMLGATAPSGPDSAPLSADDARVLDAALAAYESGTGEHTCPACGTAHDFPRALVCDRAGGAFARRLTPVLAAWREAASPRFAVIPGTRWSGFRMPESSAVWLGGVVVLWTPDGTHTVLEPGQDGWRSRELQTLWPGLERDVPTGLLVLSAAPSRAEVAE